MSLKPLTYRVLEALYKNPGLSAKELSELLGVSVEKTRSVLYKLKSSGFVEKAGRGYMLTERGVRFLEYLEKSRRPSQRESAEGAAGETTRISEEAVREVAPSSLTPESRGGGVVTPAHVNALEELRKRIEVLEKRLEDLERTVRDLERALQARQKRAESSVFLEEPVMFYSDAVSRYGQALVERLISEGRVKRVGVLLVDSEFYREFRAKFPIKVQDVDKLSHHEKVLLDEMRREAMVVLFAGREYRLVES
ncbi:MAG: winged helix-turn-helix transcriptional regulator [Desulfurococcaceae archaeon]|nr:winged helix-turn-helix transcriptional regulator [Desulfurococcaceae archaeon]